MNVNQNSWVNSEEELTNESDLTLPFQSSCKPIDQHRYGIELEQFLVQREDLSLAPYEGRYGVKWLLQELTRKHGWEPHLENGNIIELSRNGEHITLEPSGGIEYVSIPHNSLTDLRNDITQAYSELIDVLKGSELDLLMTGYHPIESTESAPLMPKPRYDFMFDYMQKVGTHGRNMMKLTASAQIAIDMTDERDGMRKLLLANHLVPYFTALTANSPISTGEKTDYRSYRTFVWENTDRTRSSFPDFLSKGSELTFQDYVDWALDVPMYFVKRESTYIPLHGLVTFREFLNGATPDVDQASMIGRAQKRDWELHLSTLFPWIRLRHYVEIRCFDMLPLPLHLGTVALVKGIFSSDESISATFAALEAVRSPKSLQEQTLEAAQAGRSTIPSGLHEDILEIARASLSSEEAEYLQLLRKMSELDPTLILEQPQHFLLKEGLFTRYPDFDLVESL